MARLVPLTELQQATLGGVFGASLPIGRIRVHIGGVASWGASRTLGLRIYLRDRSDYEAERHTPALLGLLVHEATHSWQFLAVGVRYAFGSLWDQLRATLGTGSRAGAYRYTLEAGRPLLAYGYEQQAQMVQDWYMWTAHGRIAGYLDTNCINLYALGLDEARRALGLAVEDLRAPEREQAGRRP